MRTTIKAMDAKEEQRLIRAAQAGDRDAMQALIDQHAGFLWKTALHTKARGETPEDLYQWACMEFVICVSKFNPRKKVRLSTYTYRWIQMRVNYHAKRCGVVHIPGGAMKTDRAAALRAFRPVASLSTFAGTTDDYHQDGFCMVDSTAERDLIRRETLVLDREALLPLLPMLPPRQREVLRRRLRGDTLEDIGADFGFSKSRAGQISKQAIKALRRMALGYNHRPKVGTK